VLTRETRIRAPEAITQVIPRTVIHVLVYAPDPERRQWVERELGSDTALQIARDVSELVSAVVEDSRTRPQLLVIDVDQLTAGELFHLHEIRERGWCGALIALGQVPPSLRASLQITSVIRAPFVVHSLANELVRYRCATEERTMPIPIVEPAPPVHRTFG
jgi:hypothetical protein